MSAYRDELDAAKRRVAQLDEELAAMAPVPRGWGPSSIALTLVALVGAAAAILFALQPFPAPRVINLPPAPPVAVAAPILVHLDLKMGREPLLTDVDGDGIDEVIVPTWSPAEKALYVVALDGTTFAPRWHAGPWTSEWASDAVNLTRAGDLVVVTDSRGIVHALERTTGASRGDVALDDPVHELCADAEDSARLHVRSRHGPRDMKLVDLGTLALAGTAPPSRRCDWNPLPLCERSEGTYPCVSNAYARGNGTMRNPSLAYEDADDVATIGYAPLARPAPYERPAPYGVAQDRATKKTLWEGNLSLAGDRVRIGRAREAYADHRLFCIYTSVAGPVRVVARDVRGTGDVAWSTAIPESSDESRVLSLRVARGRLYTKVDAALHVYDASSGASLARVVTLMLHGNPTLKR
jgi:hypothetical protein